MSVPKHTPQSDEAEHFDEAQPFLQLLADILHRLASEPTEPENEPVGMTEETAG